MMMFEGLGQNVQNRASSKSLLRVVGSLFPFSSDPVSFAPSGWNSSKLA